MLCGIIGNIDLTEHKSFTLEQTAPGFPKAEVIEKHETGYASAREYAKTLHLEDDKIQGKCFN